MTERERMKSVILDWMGRHDVVLREQAFTTLLQMMLELEGCRTTPDREAWISTQDRKPAQNQSVAFVVEAENGSSQEHLHGRVLGGTYHPDRGFSTPGIGFRASHWMPLPTAPNGEKK